MFWKRRGKKKDGDEAVDADAASATVTADGEDAERADAAEPETAEKSTADEAEATAATADAADASEEDAEDGGSAESGASTGAQADPGARAAEAEAPGIGGSDGDGIQCVRTEGVLRAEGEDYDVLSNTWIIDADDEGVIVIDPAHDADVIMEAVGDREIYLVACTNGYSTHISAAIGVAERDEAPIALHPREIRSWRKVHGVEHRPDYEVEGGGALQVGNLEIDVLATPGTSTGSISYYIAERGAAFTGDTLRRGEPGTVGEGYIDYTRQLASIGEVLLSLPPETRILPDSGPETTVGDESANFDSWVSMT